MPAPQSNACPRLPDKQLSCLAAALFLLSQGQEREEASRSGVHGPLIVSKALLRRSGANVLVAWAITGRFRWASSLRVKAPGPPPARCRAYVAGKRSSARRRGG